VRRILITGMSGVGKSAVIEELQRRGYRAVDLDQPEWSHYRSPDDPAGAVEWMWREEEVAELLHQGGGDILFVSGCASNQGRFYPWFDRVVLLSADPDVMRERLERRTNNDFGKDPAELARIMADKEEVEPLLRRGADIEIDTAQPLEAVVAEILEVADREV